MMHDGIKKVLILFVSLIIVLGSFPIYVLADEKDTADYEHYLAFTSNVASENIENVFETVIGETPEELAFTSTLGEKFDKPLEDGEVYYSDEVYEGRNSDDSAAYVVYAVGYNAMAAGGDESIEAAELFKHWVKTEEPTIPVIVLSKLPIYAEGDNMGSCYWNEALNFAATGVEGINSEEQEASIIRNVIVISGHDGESDFAEYAYLSGAIMPVQDDYSKVEIPEGEDGSYTSKIYYTAITAGDFELNGTATLVHISKDIIRITKYNGGYESSLGVNGETDYYMESYIEIDRLRDSDEGGPVITKQPISAVVSYPEGASFSIEVKDPDNVESYQWYMVDQADTKFLLNGYSARTDTLVIPSTQRQNAKLNFYCVVTDKDGLRSVSQYASLENDNSEENKPVFYVGEYAVEPGGKLDLANVDLGEGKKLGSGTVEFDSNGTDIIIEDLYYDNNATIADSIIAPNVGLDLEFYQPNQETYNITFVGENRIINNYYDYEYNKGGIPLDFCFTGVEEDRPEVNLIGDGTLHVTNGTYAIRTLGDLLIDIDITIDQNRSMYADGIVADNILISRGKKLEINVNGSAFTASGNLFMEDADVIIESAFPEVGDGATTKHIVDCAGTMNIINTRMDIDVLADEGICESIIGSNIISAGREMYITGGSDIKCNIRANGSRVVANYITAVTAANALLEESNLEINLDSNNVKGMVGLFTEESLIINGSYLLIDLKANGNVSGITTEKDFSVKDSNVSIKAANYGEYDKYTDIGVASSNVAINLGSAEKKVRIEVDKGFAIACDTGENKAEKPVEYTEGYTVKNIALISGTVCETPEAGIPGQGSIDASDEEGESYAIVETYYDRNDTSVPAKVLVFGYKGNGNIDVDNSNMIKSIATVVIGLAVLIIALGIVKNRRLKNK